MAAKAEPPINQRKFNTAWGELAYLCKKVHYWLHSRQQRANAERYAKRLKRVLRDLPNNNLAIIRAEGLALLCELNEQLDESIMHRSREIELMERLHKESRMPHCTASTRKYMLRGRDQKALRERREILASLQARAQKNGKLS